MTKEAKSLKRHLLGIEIPRDELALHIAIQCLGMRPTIAVDASKTLDDFDKTAPGMGEGFRRAADAAVAYFHERINGARQPQ